ncbi:hypothetical protein GW17_00057399, partial [Ensete ventricosum]
GFYSNGYGAPVPEVLIALVAYYVVVLRRSFRDPRGEVRGVPPATGEGRDVDFLCPVRVAGGEQRPLRSQTAAPPHGLLYHRRRIRQPGSRFAPASRMRVGYSVPVIAGDQTPSDHSLKGQWTAGSIPDRIKVGVRQQQCATSSPDAYFWRLRSQCRTRYVVPPGHVSELVKGFRLILKRLTFKEPQ